MATAQQLATLAAAQPLRSSYCSLAHGKVLRDDFGERAATLARDRSGLEAERVVDNATSVADSDLQRLRDLGLSDDLAAAARCFFAKTLDALGVLPDASFVDASAPDEFDVLVVGHPIAS